MDESTDPKEENKKKPDEVDLSDLENFNFAANWSEPQANRSAARDRDRGEGRRPGGGKAPDRRGRFEKGKGKPPRGRDRPAGGDEREDKSGGGEPRRGGPRRGRGDRFERRPPEPVENPYEVQIIPEESIFATLTKRMRSSLRTYELFEIARLVIEKPERFHLSFRFKTGKDESPRPLYISVPDQLPFVSEEAAIDHVLKKHVAQFFRTEEVETDPPKGTFQYVMRCPQTGDILGPPNFHRYQSILVNYHQQHFPDMPFEKFRSILETVSDEAAVQEWIDRMKKVTRYTPVQPDGTEGEPCEGIEQARDYLVKHYKDKAVKAVRNARVAGVDLKAIPDDPMRRALESYLAGQQRFPLDAANSLRGRLRRQNFYIYKKGSKGVSYVCAVKRRFRQADQVFSDSIQALIDFLEQHPLVHASELPEKHLGLGEVSKEDDSAAAETAREADPRMKRLMVDLRWLLSEGYVTEYSDGRLLVHPVAQSNQPAAATKVAASKEEEPPAAAEEEAAERALTGEPEPGQEAPAQQEATPATPETEPAGEPITAEENTAEGNPAKSEPEKPQGSALENSEQTSPADQRSS